MKHGDIKFETDAYIAIVWIHLSMISFMRTGYSLGKHGLSGAGRTEHQHAFPRPPNALCTYIYRCMHAYMYRYIHT
jgi:hypothetical protein